MTGSIIFDTHSSNDLSSDNLGVDLPGVAPVALDDTVVNVAASSGIGADGDATCLGTDNAPTAPAGKVCIYVQAAQGIDATTLAGFAGFLPTRSFGLTFDPIGVADTDEFVFATWAYTAP